MIKSIVIGNKHSRDIGRELYTHLNRAFFSMVLNTESTYGRKGEANLEISHPKQRFSTWQHDSWLSKTIVKITEIRGISSIEVVLEHSPKSETLSANYYILIKFNRNSIFWSRQVLEVLKKAAKQFPEIGISEIEFVKSKLGATFANRVHSNIGLPLLVFEGDLLVSAELIQKKLDDIYSDSSICVVDGLIEELLPEVATDTRSK